MIKVLFVCHGNICRSPMAEFLLKDMVKTREIAEKFYIASAATSTEEIGNPPHYGTRNLLHSLGISTAGKQAVRICKSDYEKYDYIIGMETVNVRNICRMLNKTLDDSKICRILDFSKHPRDIADPWYTGDFKTTYDDIMEGLEGFLEYLQKNKKI